MEVNRPHFLLRATRTITLVLHPQGAATSATKLSTARKIGNANFDGTANITLSQIGAATTEQVNQLQETVNHLSLYTLLPYFLLFKI